LYNKSTTKRSNGVFALVATTTKPVVS